MWEGRPHGARGSPVGAEFWWGAKRAACGQTEKVSVGRWERKSCLLHCCSGPSSWFSQPGDSSWRLLKQQSRGQRLSVELCGGGAVCVSWQEGEGTPSLQMSRQLQAYQVLHHLDSGLAWPLPCLSVTCPVSVPHISFNAIVSARPGVGRGF